MCVSLRYSAEWTDLATRHMHAGMFEFSGTISESCKVYATEMQRTSTTCIITVTGSTT